MEWMSRIVDRMFEVELRHRGATQALPAPVLASAAVLLATRRRSCPTQKLTSHQ
jgi:hypothetical protein